VTVTAVVRNQTVIGAMAAAENLKNIGEAEHKQHRLVTSVTSDICDQNSSNNDGSDW